MTTEEKFILMAISAYREDDNYAYSVYKELSQCGYAESTIRKYLSQLEDKGFIENQTINGYSLKFKLNQHLDCYDFIYNPNLTKHQKLFLIKFLELELPQDEYSQKRVGVLLNINKPELVIRPVEKELGELSKYQPIIIKKTLSDSYYKSENGYQIKQMNYNRECICQYCGEANPGAFNASSSITCTTCATNRRREILLKNTPKFLITQVNNGRRRGARVIENNLTEEILDTQLKKQNNKCYYTGIEFNTTNYLPSVDRVNSNIDYNKNNIVICLQEVNIMKNTLTIEQFKFLISALYKNIDNF